MGSFEHIGTVICTTGVALVLLLVFLAGYWLLVMVTVYFMWFLDEEKTTDNGSTNTLKWVYHYTYKTMMASVCLMCFDGDRIRSAFIN